MAPTTTEILDTLDHCDDESSFNFITLNHPYVYLIDSRLNIYRNGNGKWAIVSEVLGYNPRGSIISLELRYFGNGVKEFREERGKTYNYYWTHPFDWDNFQETVEYEAINPDAAFWLVRGQQIPLSHDLQDYMDAGIELTGTDEGEIRAEETARLLLLKHQELFRATDEELNEYLSEGLDKVLVIDEWYHKEFSQSKSPFTDPDFLRGFDLQNPEVSAMVDRELENKLKWNEIGWKDRPSGYETWQQIAEVIVSGDASRYKPTLAPNSHWKNWPESGSM
jgi:hypothetical protein